MTGKRRFRGWPLPPALLAGILGLLPACSNLGEVIPASIGGLPEAKEDAPSGGETATRRGRLLHAAGISPTLPSTNRHRNINSPAQVLQPRTSSSTPRRPPGAATNRTRCGNGSTT